MRISTAQLHLQAVASMLENQAGLARTQLQLSSGRRLLAPSDDPAASEQAVALTQVIEQTRQYQRNAEAARTRLGLEETVLANATELVQRARELAVQGLNDTVGPVGRAGIALELRQRLADLLALANSTDQNGEYLFAGYYKGTTLPFVDAGGGLFAYNGDQGSRELQIGPDRRITDSDHGAEVFLRIPAAGGGTQSVFATLYGLAVDLEANSPNPTSLVDLDNALGHLLEVRARVGSRLNAIDSQAQVNDDTVLQLEATRSEVQDLDYAEAIARLNQQLAALQAAQQSYLKVQGLSLFDYLR